MASQILSTRLPTNHLPFRLLSVGVSGFDQPGQSQGLLFDQDERQKHEQLDTVVDQIKDRFGSDARRRASGIRPDGWQELRRQHLIVTQNRPQLSLCSLAAAK